jgi:aerobic-type carbon monoxide dehydrogenase small subunit (CoxS/CutS family)
MLLQSGANMSETIQFTLNGKPISLEVEAERTLLWVLRSDLGLTGAKFGCGEGLCGACTVLVDDEATPSCQMTVGEAAGHEIKTIEGLAQDGKLHPIQEAFMAQEALQCGFCTSGMILKAYSLLASNPHPTREEIVAAMDDNLCRCGAHVRIIQAVETAAAALKGGRT